MADEDEEFSVEVCGDSIYFLGTVNPASAHELAKVVRKCGASQAVTRLFITSEGGCLFSAFKAYDALRAAPGVLHTYAQGLVASSAAIIFLAGEKRFVAPHAFLLIHQLSTTGDGNSPAGFASVTYTEARANVKNDQRLMKCMENILRERADIPDEKLERMLEHDRLVDAGRAVRYGIAHEISS